ncbi:MAG TPA: acyl-CoA carboxylase epsilon subunit [Nakamurella sp.]
MTERHDQLGMGVDDEDAAAVIAILTALAAASAADEPDPPTRSVWADPAHRLGLRPASASGWWASGLPS